MTWCVECGRPWGIILDRGELPTSDGAAKARVELVAMWLNWAEVDAAGPYDTEKLPGVDAVRVVYLTEAAAGFACEHLGLEMVIPDCWQNVDDADLPAWYLSSRKVRWAYRWDCCNEIERASAYRVADEVPA